MLNIINSPTNRNNGAPNRPPPPPPPPPQEPDSQNRMPPQTPVSRNNIPLASYSPTPFTYDEPPRRRDIDYLSSRREERLRRSRSLNTPSDDYNNYVITNGTTINRLSRIQNRLNRDRKQTTFSVTPMSPRLVIRTKIIECSICQDKLEKKNIVITKCDHAFCASCLFKNIRYNHKCPLCREVLTLPPVKKYHLSPEMIEHIIHQQIILHEETLKTNISNFITEHIGNIHQEERDEPILNEDEIMDITVKILESMSIFSTGVCRNIARRIETFNNANQ